MADTKTVYAVVRALEIVSEATKRLPDVYRHEYEGVDESLIWYTARNGTGALRQMAATELKRIESGNTASNLN